MYILQNGGQHNDGLGICLTYKLLKIFQFNSFKCPFSSYLVLKFVNVLSSVYQDMTQNVILQRSWP